MMKKGNQRFSACLSGYVNIHPVSINLRFDQLVRYNSIDC